MFKDLSYEYLWFGLKLLNEKMPKSFFDSIYTTGLQ